MRARWQTWVLVGIGMAPAQESRAALARIERQLHSADLAIVAGAALEAARGKVRAATPALGSALRGLLTRGDSPERTATAAAVLDALVQVESRVPEDLLLPWVDDDATRTAAMAIVFRAPADHGRTLAHWLEDRRHRLSWMLACSLRLHADPRTMVPALVRDAELVVRVGVHEAAVPWVQAGNSQTLPETSVPEGLPGFPPRVRYQWTWQASPGAVSLGEHLPGWFLARAEAGDPMFGVWSEAYHSTGQYALTLLAARAGTTSFDVLVPVDHVWRDADTLVTAVQPALAKLRRSWHGLLDGLLAKGLLDDKAAAAARDRVVVEVQDQRVDRSVPLPKLQ